MTPRGLMAWRDVLRRPDGSSVVRAWAGALVENPRSADALADIGASLGDTLGRMALHTLGVPAPVVGAYGKAAVVGVAGKLADGEAVLHPRLGRPLRDLIGRGEAIIPSTLKLGGPGARIDVPLHGIDDPWDFSLLGAVEAGSPDGPLPGEILVVVALSAPEPAQ